MQMPRFGITSSGAALRIPRLGQGADTCPLVGPRPALRGYHRLGQATQKATAVVSTAGSAATAGFETAAVIGGHLSAAAAAAATAIPLIGIGVAVVGILLKFLGKGCGAACTVTAQLHQIVDATIDNLMRVCNPGGLISGPELQAALQSFTNTADQIEEQASQYPKQVAASIKEFTADIESGMAQAANWPATPSQPWSLSAARALYVGHGTGSGELQACGPGTWYCASISQADTLTDQILTSIVNNRSTASGTSAGGIVSSLESEAESVGLTSPSGTLTNRGYLAIAAAVVGGVLLMRSGRTN